MGTHISKVKSVDLDVWTPEQMEVRSNYFITDHHYGPTITLSTVNSKMGESFSKSILGGAFKGGSCSARAVRHNDLLKTSPIG